MKEILQVVVFLLLAIPFIYMAYDVSKDVFSKLFRLIGQKAKPVLSGMISFLGD